MTEPVRAFATLQVSSDDLLADKVTRVLKHDVGRFGRILIA